MGHRREGERAGYDESIGIALDSTSSELRATPDPGRNPGFAAASSVIHDLCGHRDNHAKRGDVRT